MPALAQPAADAQQTWRLGGPRSVTPAGPGQVKEGENLNPVKTLRKRYDAWRKQQPASFK